MYSCIHKVHREWKAPTAFAAAYAHPIEYFLSNLFPVIVSILLVNPHYVSFLGFSFVGLGIILLEHSGYEFIDTHALHDEHHRRFKDNYSMFSYLDRVFGTYHSSNHIHFKED